MNPHAERAHALLSASGSDRWINCPPSARLEDDQPDVSSTHADEGTAAHELAEYRLSESLAREVDPERLAAMMSGPYYSADMEEYVQQYVDLVLEKYHEALAEDPGARIFLEQRLNLTHWIPESFGTGDVVIINAFRVIVIDLKYGKGKPVSATNNPQLKVYALGAVGTYGPVYEFDKVEVMICQPRLHSFTDWTTTVDELLVWADNVVAPAALVAWEGAGEFAAGDWCGFCKVKAQCRAFAEKQLEITRYELRQSQLLSIEEIADILGRVDELTRWASSVKEYAQVQAERNGVKFPGYKLVAGKSSRAYVDEDLIYHKLKKEGFEDDKIAPRKLLGLTAMEKLLSAKTFKNLLGGLVSKPPGKPTLVPESDGRPELNSAARDFEALE